MFPPSVEALGAVEAAAGLWSRAFASATVEPQTPATLALTPSVLAAIGRGLAVRGEAVFVLEVNGAVELTQAASWKVSGGTREESWRYTVELPYPRARWQSEPFRLNPSSTSATQRAQVRPGPVSLPWAWHLRLKPLPHGLSGVWPRKLARQRPTCSHCPKPPTLTRSKPISSLAGGGFTSLTPRPPDGVTGPQPRLNAIGSLTGSARTRRTPSASSDPTSRMTFSGLSGIPSSIHGTGGSARESYRQFLSSTIQPLAKLVVEELAVKLATPALALDFTELRAADISGRARAYGVLINAGMPPSEAAEATGLD